MSTVFSISLCNWLKSFRGKKNIYIYMHISVCMWKYIVCPWFGIRNQQAFSLRSQTVSILDFEGHNIMLGTFETFISSLLPFTLPIFLEHHVQYYTTLKPGEAFCVYSSKLKFYQCSFSFETCCKKPGGKNTEIWTAIECALTEYEVGLLWGTLNLAKSEHSFASPPSPSSGSILWQIEFVDQSLLCRRPC